VGEPNSFPTAEEVAVGVVINLKTATVEQVAAQLLTILRRNETQEPACGYRPRCVKSVLAVEFTPQALGLDVQGGGIRLRGGGVAAFGGNYDPPGWRTGMRRQSTGSANTGTFAGIAPKRVASSWNSPPKGEGWRSTPPR
jgi:hypothetical protein